MTKYSGQAATAKKLIAMKGAPVTITRQVAGAYDPATQEYSNPTTQTLKGNGVFLNWSRDEVDGTQILSSDRKALYVGDEPQQGDMIGNERVHNVMPLNPDDSTAIMYTLQVRQ